MEEYFESTLPAMQSNSILPIGYESLQRLRSSTNLTSETNRLSALVLRNHENLGIKVYDCIQDIKPDAIASCQMGTVHVALYIPRKTNAEDEDNLYPTLIVTSLKQEKEDGSLPKGSIAREKDYLKFGGREFTVDEDLSNNLATFESNIVVYTHGAAKNLKCRKYQCRPRCPLNEPSAPQLKKRKSTQTSEPTAKVTKQCFNQENHLTSKVNEILSILSNESISGRLALIRHITDLCVVSSKEKSEALSNQKCNSIFRMNATRNFEVDSETPTDEEYISDSSSDDCLSVDFDELTDELLTDELFSEISMCSDDNFASI